MAETPLAWAAYPQVHSKDITEPGGTGLSLPFEEQSWIKDFGDNYLTFNCLDFLECILNPYYGY